MDLPSLHEALDVLAQACLATENRWPYSAETHLAEASLAAATAFPIGSGEARALSLLIGAVTAEAESAGLLGSLDAFTEAGEAALCR